MTTSGDDKFRIIFICTGNVCRSPMAEAVLREKVPRTLQDKIEISSAGMKTFSGLAATAEAELAARLKGCDLSNHRSRKATETVLENADLILCMEPGQRDILRYRHPLLADRVFTLKEYRDGADGAIPDPFQKDIYEYQRILDMIDRELSRVKPAIWKAAREKLSRKGRTRRQS